MFAQRKHKFFTEVESAALVYNASIDVHAS